VSFCRLFYAVFDLLYLAWLVLISVLLLIDIRPGRPNVLRRIDRVLFVGWISKLNITIFLFTLG
jgi:hypothetical protein